ncbi:copper resistance protein CopC [Terricaulis sp.]|uniref:copper resistance CopC family protein n=1 Tax=Terricaulis sp. TaxID=2768686 RepID=UPI002AC7E29E|nr:copper resistance protein CopC [Terricaulis sp.]MDZ4689680.1 copper resistance protein CopC [Terricaulis sp.]
MRHIIAAVIAACALWTAPAMAHTTLERTSPTSGAVLSQSPSELTLTFGEPTRLTSVAVATASGERRLNFTPSGSATTFTVPAPQLAAGRNEVRWRALSRDGHPVEGSIIIVVRPPSP